MTCPSDTHTNGAVPGCTANVQADITMPICSEWFWVVKHALGIHAMTDCPAEGTALIYPGEQHRAGLEAYLSKELVYRAK